VESEVSVYGVNALAYGVIGDGCSDDASAIQRLLDADHELIYFPPGHYLIGAPLRVHSNTRVQAHRFARFTFADGAAQDAQSFLLCNADMEKGNENISIKGGIWDGNNVGNPRGEENDRNGFTGAMINFKWVRGLSLTDMTLKDSTAYHTRLSGVKDFRVERLRFQDTVHTANQDGVHVAGCCEDGLIRDIAAVGEECTGDDLVALNADDALDRSETRGKLGGPIRRIRVDGLRADDCHSFVRMASVWAELENIEINDVQGGCRVNVVNADALRGCAAPLFYPDDERYAQGAGLLRSVRLRNVRAFKSGINRTPLLRLDERMQDFSVEDFVRVYEQDAAPQVPTLQVAYQRTDDIVLEGIAEGELEACENASECGRFSSMRLPGSVPESPVFRVEAGIEPTGCFICCCRHFELFRVGSCRLEPLPEPDRMVAKGQYK